MDFRRFPLATLLLSALAQRSSENQVFASELPVGRIENHVVLCEFQSLPESFKNKGNNATLSRPPPALASRRFAVSAPARDNNDGVLLGQQKTACTGSDESFTSDSLASAVHQR